jgi:uncharacterized protein (TIGR03437 family)
LCVFIRRLFVKQAFRLLCAMAVLAFFWLSLTSAKAQTSTSATPDSIIAQISNSTVDSFANDMSGDGRFVVFQSSGNIATEQTLGRNNFDGNREIFLYDYAQRRIFQITNTKSSIQPNPSPTPTATPTATPSPTASPTPTPTPSVDPSTVQVDVSNNNPVLSNDGKWIVFSSNAGGNAGNPGNYDGTNPANAAALLADGNQEIWMYQIPDVTPVDLTAGADVPKIDLTGGTFKRVTNTPASLPPQPGSSTLPPTEAFDNRDPAVNDNGTIISFVSNRNLTGGNADGSPEIIVSNVAGDPTFTQVTNTPVNVKGFLGAFTENPNLSGDGTVLAFASNANIPQTGGTASNPDFNTEIFVATLNGTTVTNIKQVTNTVNPTSDFFAVTVLSPGRRLSRNGQFLAMESRADLSGGTGVQAGGTVFIYDTIANTFKQVGPRPTTAVLEGGRFPTFTGDSSTLIFSSVLNFTSDGTVPATATDGLNPNGRVQLYAVAVSPPGTANFFQRLTDTPAPLATVVPQIQAYASNSLRRIAFTVRELEFGGGNADLSFEGYYMLVPPNTGEVAATPSPVRFFTGASNSLVVGPSPATSPSPSEVLGLAPGELGLVRPAGSPAPAVTLAPSAVFGCPETGGTCASEGSRAPALPIEVNGVSMSIGGGATGLYFVSPGQLNFVVPPGFAPSSTPFPVVINNNGAVVRSLVSLLFSVPDIFTTTTDAGGRASVLNVTKSLANGTAEPFSVTSTDSTGATVPTVLDITLTGVRLASTSQVTVRIGTTDITGTSILAVGPIGTAGFDHILLTLPSTLAAAGDVPIIVTVVNGTGGTFSSRPADTAPHITIN